MKWVREYAWLPILALALVYFVWLRPARGVNPKEAIAQLDAQRAEIERSRAEWEARRAEFDQKQARLQTDHTLFLLRMVGEAYRFHLSYVKRPPQAADLADEAADWKSARDGQPFAIAWGVDPAKLPDGGTKMLLAWEPTAAADGSRCVLLADAKTAKVMTAAEFAALPKAAATR